MKKKYEKPMFTEVKIETVDLCAGSRCETVDINFLSLKRKQEKNLLFEKGETDNLWNKKF